MNKRLITVGLIILGLSIIGKLVWSGLRSIKVDDFKPAAVIFVVDSSASNQKGLDAQKKSLRQICNILDPEDVCGKGCINETFRVLKERELRELGEYRTKRLVMEAWNKFEFDNKLKMLCYEK